jgi:phosphohistidine phosphatase
MVQRALVPDLVLCSAALRAVETWQAVSAVLGRDVEVDVREDIYHAGPGEILDTIRALPGEVGSVLLVGHNPAFEDLALALAGNGEDEALKELERKYPTGALAVLDFQAQDWDEVREGAGWLRAFIRPKDLK